MTDLECSVAWQVVLEAAYNTIVSCNACTLITHALDGSNIQARVVVAYKPLKDLRKVIFTTNKHTRKVEELRHNPHATLFYKTAENDFVTLQGTCKQIDDPKAKESYWINVLADYYEGGAQDPNFVVEEFTVQRIEMVSSKYNIATHPKRWYPAVLVWAEANNEWQVENNRQHLTNLM